MYRLLREKKPKVFFVCLYVDVENAELPNINYLVYKCEQNVAFHDKNVFPSWLFSRALLNLLVNVMGLNVNRLCIELCSVC